MDTAGVVNTFLVNVIGILYFLSHKYCSTPSKTLRFKFDTASGTCATYVKLIVRPGGPSSTSCCPTSYRVAVLVQISQALAGDLQ